MASFVPDTFADGPAGNTPITAAKLNNAEQGIVQDDITNPASNAAVLLTSDLAAKQSVSTLDSTVAGYINGSSNTRTALGSVFGIYAPAPTGVAATDTANLQPLITAAQATGGTLFLQAGTYVVTNLTTSSSGTQPKIVGKGEKLTYIQGTTANAALMFVGNQTGSFSGGYISDLTFTGTGIGLELRGVVGVGWDRIAFTQPLTEGIRFHNYATGDFTEMCSGQADFQYIATAIEYKVTSGNPSFHGSGLQGRSTLNQPASATGPIVLIGAGARPYNAPLEVTCWVATPAQALILNQSSQLVNFYGTITVEFASAATVVDNTSTTPVPFVGEIVSLGASGGTFNLGQLQIVDRLSVAGAVSTPFSAYDSLAVETAGWVAYTPTLGNITLGNGTVVGFYRVRGKSVEFAVLVTFGTTSVMGTGPYVGIPGSLPQGQTFPVILGGQVVHSGGGTYSVIPALGSNLVVMNCINTSGAYAQAASITATVPFTWATGDTLQLGGSYQTS